MNGQYSEEEYQMTEICEEMPQQPVKHIKSRSYHLYPSEWQIRRVDDGYQAWIGVWGAEDFGHTECRSVNRYSQSGKNSLL